MTTLRLYVWKGVFTDYTDGVAWALAKSPAQARRLIYGTMSDWQRERYQDELRGAPEVYHSPVGFWQMGGA